MIVRKSTPLGRGEAAPAPWPLADLEHLLGIHAHFAAKVTPAFSLLIQRGFLCFYSSSRSLPTGGGSEPITRPSCLRESEALHAVKRSRALQVAVWRTGVMLQEHRPCSKSVNASFPPGSVATCCQVLKPLPDMASSAVFTFGFSRLMMSDHGVL